MMSRRQSVIYDGCYICRFHVPSKGYLIPLYSFLFTFGQARRAGQTRIAARRRLRHPMRALKFCENKGEPLVFSSLEFLLSVSVFALDLEAGILIVVMN
jgi:hypothetical protein